MTTRPIRILVVDDHFLPRLAVTTLVAREPDLQVVGEAETGWQAVNLAKQLAPDVVLMDLRLPELDGVAATAALARDVPAAAVLVLSHYEGTEDVNRALAAGARGYVKKDVEGAVLVEAIRQVAAGKRFIPADVGAQLAESVGREPLTRRELEILQLVFQGATNAQIAERLAITEGTVRIHVSNILYKLGVKRRTEAVSEALKRGILRSG